MEATGTVMSFNYLYTAVATTPIQHLAYQDYEICIRQNTVIVSHHY